MHATPYLLLVFTLGLLTSCNTPSHAVNYPEEVGPAHFLRNFNEAAQQSEKTSKPIFAFFQEIPG